MENKDQLIDIYDIWYEPVWQKAWFGLVVKIGMCAVVAALFYYVYKKYIQKPVIVDCAVIAYRDLDTLKNFHIVTKQDSKDCYFSLSSIIKRYLACRYNIIFTQLTDKEIVKQAEPYMDSTSLRALQRLLQGMTLMKFEHEIAVTDKLEKDILQIKEFIQETTLQQHDTKEN